MQQIITADSKENGKNLLQVLVSAIISVILVESTHF